MQRVFMFVAAVSAAGCVADEGNQGFVLLNNLQVQSEDTCAFDADVNAAFLPRGKLFANSPTPYVLTPLIQSRITAVEGRESLRTILLKGARVDLSIGPIEIIDGAGNVTTDSAVDTLQFESLFSAPLLPNGGTTFASFDLVPLSALQTIRTRAGQGNRVHAQVVGTLRAFGDFYGEEIESEVFTYPVTVCNDCVVQSIFPACPAPMGTPVRTGNPCNPFQDGDVDCCDAGGGALLCPSTVSL